MGSDHLLPNCLTGMNQSISSDSFVVDTERFAHLIDNDAKPRILGKLSRKGTIRNEIDGNMLATSPRATLHGGRLPEKQGLVAPGHHNHSAVSQPHHQITITNGSISSTAAAESMSGGKRFSFRRSSPAWIIDPRRIFFVFSTLSCMGTILLIYFTLSMGKLNGEENASS